MRELGRSQAAGPPTMLQAWLFCPMSGIGHVCQHPREEGNSGLTLHLGVPTQHVQKWPFKRQQWPSALMCHPVCRVLAVTRSSKNPWQGLEEVAQPWRRCLALAVSSLKSGCHCSPYGPRGVTLASLYSPCSPDAHQSPRAAQSWQGSGWGPRWHWSRNAAGWSWRNPAGVCTCRRRGVRS